MIVSLFDETGLAVEPWLRRGFHALIADILHKEDSEEDHLTKISGDILKREVELVELLRGLPIHLMCAFPPCTDLAVSGSKHFATKAAADPFYLDKALELVYVSIRIGNALGCPYFVENPVSVLSTLWRPPDFTWHPYEFGGYLPENDWHPRWPDYIPPRDAYPKLTCLWAGNGFILPPKKPVPRFSTGWSPQTTSLGGKSQKTKTIRSATPRGFAEALFQKYSIGVPKNGEELR